ncbi:hypothetical protein BD560DRAFT_390096 [Blakeslea trispora]|nr:hypothetical protein BD560DRAFT_390096 [Blakeslea trispora]
MNKEVEKRKPCQGRARSNIKKKNELAQYTRVSVEHQCQISYHLTHHCYFKLIESRIC